MLNITPTFRAAFAINDRSTKRADLLGFCESVQRLASEPLYANPLEISETSAGPCWDAYYVIYSDERAPLESFLAQLPDIARRYRVKLEDWEK